MKTYLNSSCAKGLRETVICSGDDARDSCEPSIESKLPGVPGTGLELLDTSLLRFISSYSS